MGAARPCMLLARAQSVLLLVAGLVLWACTPTVNPITRVPSTPSPVPEPSPEPPTPEPARALVYQSNQAGNWEILLGWLGSDEAWNLTAHEAEDRNPAWSPDGRTVAFESHRDGNWDIYLLEMDTGAISRLTEEIHYDGSPAWAPEGDRIAFESYRDGNLNLYQIGLATGELTRLTDDPAGDYGPSWSPDGSNLAFTSWRDGDKEIYVLDLEAGSLRNVTDHPADDEDPSWSLDGRRLAFISTRDGIGEVYSLDLESGDLARITSDDVGQRAPAWLPGGGLIYAEYDKGEPFEVYHEFRDGHWNLTWGDSAGETLGVLQVPGDQEHPTPTEVPVMPPAWAQHADFSEAGSQLPETPGTEGTGEPQNGSRGLVSLFGDPAGPFRLYQTAAEAFFGLREVVLERSGYDYLGTLSDAFRPPDFHRTRYSYLSWHKTGRAVDLLFELREGEGGDRLEVVREDIGSETYWRILIRVRSQDGSMGEPLKSAPWQWWFHFSRVCDPDGEGGRPKPIPQGYYLDFTELATRFGWQRIAAYEQADFNWKCDTLGREYWHYNFMEGLRWYEAISLLYPEQALAEHFSWEEGLAFGLSPELLERKGLPPPDS